MSEQAFVFPTSFAQRRIWFLSQLMPDSPFYNIHTVVPLPVMVDRAALGQALQEIVRRHEVLRTCFVVVDGEPMQAVSAEMPITLPIEDLQHLPTELQPAEVLRLATEDLRRPFDLTAGPLIRARLLVLQPDNHVLLITLHHIISDAWSLGILLAELRELYAAFLNGRLSPLPELPIQYADFSVWQREWLQGEVLEGQLAYWRETLAGLPALTLPTDHRRPPISSFRGASHTFDISRVLTDRLKELARSEGCTLFMVLLAAFKVVLSRYAGQDDVVVGAPIANRTRAELEPLIGFFVNTLVLRTDLSGDPPFRELLARVREVTLGAYAHQDLPFEKLVEELQPERDLSRNPLFQVTFQMQNAPPVTELATAGHHGGGKRLDVQRGTANFDIAFDVWEADGGLVGRFDYSTDLFEVGTMARMAGHYRSVLEGVASNPATSLRALPLLAEQELSWLLAQRDGPPTDYPRNQCVHELFAEQAERTPTAVAVSMDEERLTYRELELSANRVANWLRAHGVAPDVPVGVQLERSPDLIVALLGILKAGGVYVALDPGDPRSRTELLLHDAGISVLITKDRSRGELGRPGLTVLSLEGDAELLGEQPASAPKSGASAENLAYVAYTSGSTGTPKGVSVSHRSAVRLACGSGHARLGPDEAVLQFSPVAFDASTFEIWGCLLNGGRLVVHPPGPASLAELGHTLVEQRVTTAWLTAGLFHQMVDEQLDSLLGVRQLLAGGDVLSAAHVRAFLQPPGKRCLINGYGPTEGTTFTCCHVMSAPDEVDDPVPIGRPIAGTAIYILDDGRRPVPIGVPGELYIGGDGVARGYLNRQELTAERFVPDPFEPGGRLYRSGDLVRYRADGVVEFLGRVDRQVKIRGFRVEPGEVEAALGQHPAVEAAAVVTREAGDGGRSLSAYVTVGVDQTPSPAGLRKFLQERVPAYLIPSEFVVVDAIPLTVNGKVDVESLRRVESPQLVGPAEYVAAGSEVEEALVEIWEQILHRQGIGIHDDFFADLGGHSLLGTQLVSRVRDAFGIEIPLRRLFESPTVCGFAAAVEETILEELEAEGSEEEALISGEMEPLVMEGIHGFPG